MSVAPFAAGLIVGGIQYGLAKYQLQDREDVVHYSADHVKESFYGANKKQTDERYVPLRSREHEYYTSLRQGWNAKVLGFRDAAVDFFKAK
ncbi:hypothetical protein Poli38472_005518 [Pythium oligandrum]|uniref:Uncharacterized protein n=1 Tax=Pythium oligandrum TaxID=41045 RepID=A0A8K1CHN7_PYTOL|nr:hypothetical protein Poli38472_005518 [Pythium oligandrum]|eukprot:TMW62900.1 hypothetical protein Poli38472_005518 [Pythium oligandrum]